MSHAGVQYSASLPALRKSDSLRSLAPPDGLRSSNHSDSLPDASNNPQGAETFTYDPTARGALLPMKSVPALVCPPWLGGPEINCVSCPPGWSQYPGWFSPWRLGSKYTALVHSSTLGIQYSAPSLRRAWSVSVPLGSWPKVEVS